MDWASAVPIVVALGVSPRLMCWSTFRGLGVVGEVALLSFSDQCEFICGSLQVGCSLVDTFVRVFASAFEALS